MSKIVAIHQPNFFPWLGYFDKIARSDVFIFLDDVQFPKTGGVWINRVKLLIGGEARWITAAIDRSYSGVKNIRDTCFLPMNPWREKMLKSLQISYGRHPFFEETIALLEPLVLNPECNIAEYNIHAIVKICEHLGINTNKFERSADIESSGESNELLISLTHSVEGNAYLCGGGADGYQNDDLFEQCAIRIIYQGFNPTVYKQRGHAHQGQRTSC
jgi:hypothetical protein